MNRAGLDMIDSDSFDQVKGLCVYPLVSEEYRVAFKAMVEAVFKGESRTLEFKVIGLKGRPIWLYSHAVPLRNDKGDIVSMLSATVDITERKEAEALIMQAMSDKDMLMREIHHRVKNNLAVIQSLLSLQMKDIKDEMDRAYFKDAENRVRSMTMIHERLHNSEDLKNIGAEEYIRSLSEMLFHNYTTGNNIRLVHEIQDASVDVDIMIPLGLILNELVSNALKYAFPDGRKGTLKISFTEPVHQEYLLVVRDDGIGLPGDFEIKETRTLGLMIVKALARQLGAEMAVSGDKGAGFRLRFKDTSPTA